MNVACPTASEEIAPDGALAILKRVHSKLADTKFEFSHRTAHECVRYAQVRKDLAAAGLTAAEEVSNVMDTAILQKVLPKLNGAQSTIEPIINALLEATQEGADGTKMLPRSHSKLLQMQKALERDQFISFIQ